MNKFNFKKYMDQTESEMLGQFIKFSEKCISNKSKSIYRTRVSNLAESKLTSDQRKQALKHAEVMFLTGSPSLTEVSKATSLSRDTVKDLKRKMIKNGLLSPSKVAA